MKSSDIEILKAAGNSDTRIKQLISSGTVVYELSDYLANLEEYEYVLLEDWPETFADLKAAITSAKSDTILPRFDGEIITVNGIRYYIAYAY